MKISIIAAIGEKRELGKDNKLLWYIPEDMKRFKRLTEGHVVIMGRKTYESIAKPLTNRFNIIITKDKNYDVSMYRHNDTMAAHSFENAIKKAQSKTIQNKFPGEIFIIGGGQIYEQAMKFAEKLYLTIIKGKFDADTYFPDYSEFKKVVFKKESKDKNYRSTFLELVKV